MKQYICPHCLKKINYDNFWFKCAKFSQESYDLHDKTKKGVDINKKITDTVGKKNQKDTGYCATLRKAMDYPDSYPRQEIAEDFGNGYFKYQGHIKKNRVPTEAKCYYCGERTKIHICPLCKEEINIDENDSQFIINLAGPKSSGKSDFLGSVLYMIRHRFSRIADEWKVSFNEHAKKYYENFIARVKTKMGDPTMVGAKSEPAIVMFEKTEGKARKKYSFIFYDIAGEILTSNTDSGDRARKAKKFSRPDYIIYFCDPARLDGVHSDLIKSRKENIKEFTKKFIKGDDHIASRDDNEQNITYISCIRDFLGDIYFHNGEKNQEEAYGKADTPIGVCLTMIDVLEDIYTDDQIANRKYFKAANYLYDRRVNMRDYIDNELEEKSKNLIKQFNTWEERNFINYMDNNFGETKYFAISALGTDDDNLSSEMTVNFKPRNVLDPFIWFASTVAPEILEVNPDIQNVIEDTETDVFNDFYDTFDDVSNSNVNSNVDTNKNSNESVNTVDSYDDFITDDDE